jgi:hypothetical protein
MPAVAAGANLDSVRTSVFTLPISFGASELSHTFIGRINSYRTGGLVRVTAVVVDGQGSEYGRAEHAMVTTTQGNTFTDNIYVSFVNKIEWVNPGPGNEINFHIQYRLDGGYMNTISRNINIRSATVFA